MSLDTDDVRYRVYGPGTPFRYALEFHEKPPRWGLRTFDESGNETSSERWRGAPIAVTTELLRDWLEPQIGSDNARATVADIAAVRQHLFADL